MKIAPAKYQQHVLCELGIQTDEYRKAKKIFAEHGMYVSFKRVGRHTYPVVTLLVEPGYFQEEHLMLPTISSEDLQRVYHLLDSYSYSAINTPLVID